MLNDYGVERDAADINTGREVQIQETQSCYVPVLPVSAPDLPKSFRFVDDPVWPG